jgi:two-component system, cell cycle sensor histidine kinase and response regulator CckA
MTLAETGIAPRGTETILLVEPEPETRKLAAFMLSKVGYNVLEARNAGEACKVYEDHGAPVDLLLTEAPMSKINGHELAEMLCARDPGLRVLYLSDPDYERLTRRAAAEKGLAFLHRPFTMRLLAGKVRQVLDAPNGRRRVAVG